MTSRQILDCTMLYKRFCKRHSVAGLGKSLFFLNVWARRGRHVGRGSGSRGVRGGGHGGWAGVPRWLHSHEADWPLLLCKRQQLVQPLAELRRLHVVGIAALTRGHPGRARTLGQDPAAKQRGAHDDQGRGSARARPCQASSCCLAAPPCLSPPSPGPPLEAGIIPAAVHRPQGLVAFAQAAQLPAQPGVTAGAGLGGQRGRQGVAVELRVGVGAWRGAHLQQRGKVSFRRAGEGRGRVWAGSMAAWRPSNASPG